jgi:hypothetical protein
VKPIKFGSRIEATITAALIIGIYEILVARLDQRDHRRELGIAEDEKATFLLALEIIASLAATSETEAVQSMPSNPPMLQKHEFSMPCCKDHSVIVGHNPRHGAVYRCNHCKNYWAINSNRLWIDINDPVTDPGMGLSQVFFGPGELGLANALVIGSQFGSLLLGVDLGTSKEN